MRSTVSGLTLFLCTLPAPLFAQTPIVCGQTLSGAIGSPAQVVMFSFAATAGEAVVITADATSGTLNARAELYRPSGPLLTSNGAGNASTISTVLPESGTYTIHILDFGSDGTGNFDLNLQFTTGRCGTAIACGQTLSGTTTSTARVNSYAFSAAAGEAVIVTADSTSGVMTARAELYGPTGQLVATSGVGNASTISASLGLTGTYTILVLDFGLDATGTYDVNLQFTSGRCGARIACGQTLSGATTSTARVNSYAFNAAAGEAVIVTADSTSGVMTARAELYGPTGQLVTTSGVGNASTISASLGLTGTYTILVLDFGLDATGTYDVNLQFTTGRCGTTLGCGQTLNGATTSTAQANSYVFSGNSGDSVTITSLATLGLINARAELYGPTGQLVATNGAGNSTIGAIPISTGGVHTILIKDFGFDGLGAYSVSMTGTGAVCSCATTVSPPTAQYTPAGGSGSFNVSSGATCQWRAVSDAPWLSVTGAASGSGAAAVSYSVQANTGPRRLGTISVVGQRLSVLQSSSGTLFTRYLAEGATSPFFDTSIALLNLEPSQARTTLSFLRSDGTTILHELLLNPTARATVDPKTIPGLQNAEFSTVVESDKALAVDRTMRWDASGYGSHAETAITSPATIWYLAEGATHSGFDLFYLLQNPGQATANVTITYLRPAPLPPLVRNYTVMPQARFNIWVDLADPALASVDVSASISSDQPIVVERAMYLSGGGQLFRAGHESAGVTATSTHWFLAEGATGSFFDMFVLIANPTTSTSQLRATYLLPDGSTVTKDYTIAANSRFNIWVDYEDPRLADTAVSTTLTALNGVPVIVERAMWWPSPVTSWTEAHDTAGATTTGTRWALADGEVGGVNATETYILIANTSIAPGNATTTLYFDDGTSLARTYALNGSSRLNVPVKDDFPLAVGRRFGAIVESGGPTPLPLVVERAMYSNAGGIVWAAGTAALASRVQ